MTICVILPKKCIFLIALTLSVHSSPQDPVTVFIGSLDLAAVHSVRQEIYYIEDEEDKRRKLVEFLDSMEPDEKVPVVLGMQIGVCNALRRRR